MNVAVAILGRNEAENLPKSIASVLDQTCAPDSIVYIDDDSTDDSARIAQSFGVRVVRSVLPHPNWTGTPQLSCLVNLMIREALRDGPDAFVVQGGDIAWRHTYLEGLVRRMGADPGLVVASGHIRGEAAHPDSPRGAGRMYRTDFWRTHVGEHPYRYTWETWPLLVARLHGYRVRLFTDPDVTMTALRPTRTYKPQQGHSLRELGWLPHAVLLLALQQHRARPRDALHLLRTYATSPYRPPPGDPVARNFREEQRRALLGAVRHPVRALRRARG